MKKKLFLVVTCLLLVALTLVGCADYSQQFDKLNKLLNANYSQMNLTVTVTQDSNEFTSVFDVEYGADDSSTIQFTIRRLATFSNDGTLPDNFIETFEGSATVKNGQVTNVSGDLPDDVTLARFTGIGIKFNQNYFSKVKPTDNTMTVNVSNPKAFMGQTGFVCKPDTMVVSVRWHNDGIEYVRIQYTATNGSKVVMMYTFTK